MRRCLLRYSAPRVTHTFPDGSYDFDAWAYNMQWPSAGGVSSPFAQRLAGQCLVAVEDIKFAINAWMLLRLCMFYGLRHPSVVKKLQRTTPSMAIHERGNRLFYMHSSIDTPLATHATKIALTPSHPEAVSLYDVDWSSFTAGYTKPVQLVLGMENGLSDSIVAQCDRYVYIPQYGSIGSLSMLSALSIAVHHAHCHLSTAGTPQLGDETGTARAEPLSPKAAPLLARQPMTSEYHPPRVQRPHDPAFLGMTSNDDIRAHLASCRAAFPLQLSLLIRNEIADRSIGASIRNANVYNCDNVLIFNRKKFNARGTVGTHHYTPVKHFETRQHLIQSAELDGMEVWLLHCSTYPYLHVHYQLPDDEVAIKERTKWIDGKKRRRQAFETFLRPDHPSFKRWVDVQDLEARDASQSLVHPMRDFLEGPCHTLLHSSPIALDDEVALCNAVARVKASGKRGIVLAMPEEGCTPHPELVQLAHRIVYVVDPRRLDVVQRGLTPALASAIALERLRFAMDRNLT